MHCQISRSPFLSMMVVLLDVAGVILVMPILTPLILNADSGMLSTTTSPFTRDFLYGLSLSLYPLFMFFSTPILGDLSDRFGRKKILQTCLMGTVFSYLMAALGIMTNQLAFVLISRCMAGLAAGTQPIATAAIIDLSTPKNKTRYLSWVVFMTSLGFIIGPMVGGFAGDHHISRWFTYQTPFLLVAAFAFIISLLLQLTYTENPIKQTQQRIQLTKGFSLFIAAFAQKNFRYVSALFFCFILAWSLYYQTINWFFMEKFHYTVAQMGLFVAFIGIIFAITSSTLSKFILRLFKNEQHAFAFFIFTMGIGAIGSALSTSELAQWCWVVVIAMSDVICYILSFSLFSSLVDKDAQGWAMGVMSALSAFTWTFGGLIAGPLGYAALQLPTLIAGLLCFVSFIVMILFQQEKNTAVLSEQEATS